MLLVLGLILAIALGGARGGAGRAADRARFVLEWGYYVFFETTGDGRSPGKRALSLRVVKEGGYPIGFIDSVLRNLLRGADFLPVGYVVGLFTMAARLALPPAGRPRRRHAWSSSRSAAAWRRR